jgi:hypothetical protein
MFLETAARIGPVKAHRIMSLAVRGDLGSKSGLGHAERNLEVATLQIAHILAES